MRAEIISIGTEIMLGEITDTNAAFIAGQLPQYGIDLLHVSQTGDNPTRMREIFERAASSGESTSVVADRLAQERLGVQHAVQKHPQRLQA